MRTKTDLQEAKMLDAAARLFGTYRFHEVRMEDIASEAVVGKGTLYRYFKDKEELYDALLERASRQLLARLHEAQDQADNPRTRLEALVTAIIAFFDEHPHLSDLILRAETVVRPGQAFPWQKTRDAVGQLLHGIFTDAQSRGEFAIRDPEDMILMLQGGLRSVIRSGAKPRAEDLPRRLVAAFLDGAAARAS